MNDNFQCINLEEGSIYVFDKWIKIGMNYEEVMDSFAENIESNNILDIPNHEGCACITLHDASLYGFPFSIDLYFENYVLDEFLMQLIPNGFKNEASNQGITNWYDLLKYVGEKFKYKIHEQLGDIGLKYFDVNFHYEVGRYSLGSWYDRDMISYYVKMKVK